MCVCEIVIFWQIPSALSVCIRFFTTSVNLLSVLGMFYEDD